MFGPNDLMYGIVRYFFGLRSAMKKIIVTPKASMNLKFGNIWTL